MKNMWILGIIAMLFLAACAPATMEKKDTLPLEPAAPTVTTPVPVQTTPPAEIGAKPPVRPLPSERQVSPPPTEVVVEQKASMSPALRDLLKRADEKVSSLQYLYGGTETQNLFLNTYLVKGDKLRVKTYEENYYVREGYYDNVYVNQGIGCCEELSRCKSHNIDNTGKKFDVDAAVWTETKTPYQWTKEVPSTAVIVGPQTVNSRSVTYIKYTDANGQEVQQWIDDTYGVAHKVVVIDKNGNEIKYQFNDMVFNSLKDSDFVPPCA